MKMMQLFLLVAFLSSPVALAADPATSRSKILDPVAFSKLVEEKNYKDAHDTAVAEAKLVPEELDYVRKNKLIPEDKRHIYLRRPLEYYEVLLATGEDALAKTLEEEIFKTLPKKACVNQMLAIASRLENRPAQQRLFKRLGDCWG